MFDVPLSRFMTVPVASIGVTATLAHARERMAHARVSALPIVDERGRPLGVISRSDLLRLGRAGPPLHATLVLEGQVGRSYTHGVMTVPADASVADAARHFVDGHIHRVFVESDGRLIGVLSGRDLIAAVAERRLGTPLSSVMSQPLHTIDARAPLARAVDRLVDEHISSLVVLERGRHVGIFSRHDALQAGDRAPGVPVGEAMTLAPLVLPAASPVCDAAVRALAANARQILVRDDGSIGPADASMPDAPTNAIVGIVTSTDLAGAALMGGWVARG